MCRRAQDGLWYVCDFEQEQRLTDGTFVLRWQLHWVTGWDGAAREYRASSADNNGPNLAISSRPSRGRSPRSTSRTRRVCPGFRPHLHAGRRRPRDLDERVHARRRDLDAHRDLRDGRAGDRVGGDPMTSKSLLDGQADRPERRGRMETVIETIASGMGNGIAGSPSTASCSWCSRLIWAAFAIAVIWSQGSLDQAWQTIRSWPLIGQIVAWILFLPVVFGLWAWETSWPLVVRLILVIGAAGWNLLDLPAKGRAIRQKARQPQRPGAHGTALPRSAGGDARRPRGAEASASPPRTCELSTAAGQRGILPPDERRTGDLATLQQRPTPARRPVFAVPETRTWRAIRVVPWKVERREAARS